MPLGSHANVYNTCLFILRDRGFKMHVEGELDDEGCYPTDALWVAEKSRMSGGREVNAMVFRDAESAKAKAPSTRLPAKCF